MTWRITLFSSLAALIGVAAACGKQFTSAGNTGAGAATGGGDGTGGEDVTDCVDNDGDGWTDCQDDCDDDNPLIFPGATEICGDDVDNACGSEVDPVTLCGGLGTYVSALTGDDSNPGTQNEPVASIAEGMNKAVQLVNMGVTQPVFVAQGDYLEDVNLIDGVSLWGGYNCGPDGCPWDRDASKYTSTIENQDADGVNAVHNVTSATEVTGFRILGLTGNPGSGNTFSAMYLQGSPRIASNRIISGDVSGCGTSCGSIAIVLEGSATAGEATLLEANAIQSGESTGSSIGILMQAGAVADILFNEITGGKGNWPRAVVIQGGGSPLPQAVLRNNEINAGACAGTSTGSTFAMFLGPGVTPTIDANRINTEGQAGKCRQFTGQWWTGGIESQGSEAIITNNIVHGVDAPRSTAILLADCEGPCQLGQPIVINNTLDGVGGTDPADISAALVLKVTKLNQNVSLGRIRNNILIGGVAGNSFGGYEDLFDSNGAIVGSSVQPDKFDNNLIFGATTLYQGWENAQIRLMTSIANVNANVNNANDNISADPQLDGQDHIATTSPCIDTGTRSGGETPALDFDGEARPQGDEVDIGADEAG